VLEALLAFGAKRELELEVVAIDEAHGESMDVRGVRAGQVRDVDEVEVDDAPGRSILPAFSRGWFPAPQ
jgi:hypothetical protein